MTSTRRLIPLLALTGLIAGCGSSYSTKSSPPATSTPASSTPAAATPAPASGPAAVAISDYKFAPRTIAVKRGGVVTFNNNDPTAHTATADTGSTFDTGTLQKGQSKAVTFNTAGTFPYHCVFHAFMTGSVVVS